MIVHLQGVAVVFGDLTAEGPLEVIRPGAFAGALERGHPVRLETLHDGEQHVYARTSIGTMRVEDLPAGLFFEADLDITDPRALNLVRAVEAGFRHCSVSFKPLAVQERPDGVTEVLEARLREISICGRPCYARTGCWLADEDRLPEHVEALRALWCEPGPMVQPYLDDATDTVKFRRRAA